MQKEVQELLAKGGIEPSTGGTGFYSNVFVIFKNSGGLHPTLNIKCFIHYMYIPSLYFYY